MTLAEKIMRERKRQGWSQEELAERLEVSRQSVSKWEGGLSSPDLDKIVAMSTLFGVTTDYLLKNDVETFEKTPEREEPTVRYTQDAREDASDSDSSKAFELRQIDEAEARRYLGVTEQVSWRIAIGVLFCVLSPVCLIWLAGFSDAGQMSETLAAAIGLIFLFGFIAAGVAMFIPNGMKLSEYAYLKNEAFLLTPDAQDTVQARHSGELSKLRMMITVGVLLCIVGLIPMMAVSCLYEDWEIGIVSFLCLFLIFVAVATVLFVRAGMMIDAYQKLLQVGEFRKEQKAQKELADRVGTVYWCVVLAVY
ncbi:MAG: helix-turn-helix transcriptional regulator, partial [Clostridia bacterium]|nr:helix-turn-helix transcriptional regulator [Clostridia bacterium]